MSQSSQIRDTASEKEAWTAPVLRELHVDDTANSINVPGGNDGLEDCS